MEHVADRGAEAPERVAVLVARIIIAVVDTVAQLLLEDPGTWKPEELAGVVAQLLSGGLNSI